MSFKYTYEICHFVRLAISWGYIPVYNLYYAFYWFILSSVVNIGLSQPGQPQSGGHAHACTWSESFLGHRSLLTIWPIPLVSFQTIYFNNNFNEVLDLLAGLETSCLKFLKKTPSYSGETQSWECWSNYLLHDHYLMMGKFHFCHFFEVLLP